MVSIGKIKKSVYSILKKSFYYNPNIFFTFKPLKIYEFKELVKNAKITHKDIILDVGCGQGLPTLLIGKKCKKIYGIDISKRFLRIAKMRSRYLKRKVNREFLQIRLEHAGFKEEFFDKVFFICVLEHIPNYIEVLTEAHRVLRKGGKLLLSVDSLEAIDDKKLVEYQKKKCHVENYFREYDLMKTLSNIGFNDIVIYPIFRSDYAKKLYTKHLEDINEKQNKFRHLNFLYRYIILKHRESRCLNQKKGIFLIAKCYK